MGFWGTLGKGLLGAAGAAAAPFTGGASLGLTLGAAGLGALGGLAGGGSYKLPKWVEQNQRYWAQRMRDQEEQAARYYGESRGRAAAGYEDIWETPGFTDEEARGLYYTPEEALRLQYSPEEAAALQISPEEEAGIISTSLAPISGSMQRAQDALTRAAAARGNYGGGYGASIQRVQEEGARQAADAALRARLGIAEARREGAGRVADVRRGAAGLVSGQRIGATGAIGEARMRGRQFAAGGRERLSAQDLNAMMGYGRMGAGGTPEPAYQPSTFGRTLGGIASGALYGLQNWVPRRRSLGTPGPGWSAAPDYFEGG